MFAAAVARGEYALAIVGVLAAVVAAFFYLRVAIALFTPPAADEPRRRDRGPSRPVDLWSGIVLLVAAGMTLVIGVLPGTFITFSEGCDVPLAVEQVGLSRREPLPPAAAPLHGPDGPRGRRGRRR